MLNILRIMCNIVLHRCHNCYTLHVAGVEGDWRLGTGETGPVTRPSLATLHSRYLHYLHCRYLHYLYCSRPALTISIIHGGEVDIYLSAQTCRAAAFTHKLTKLAILHRPTSLSLKPFLCTNNRHFKVKE